MLKTAFLATGVFASLPDPVVPPCETYQTPDPQEMTINLAHIAELGNNLYDNFMSEGACFRLVEERIYGALQLSDSLLEFGDNFSEHFEKHRNDMLYKERYSKFVKSEFKDAFEVCGNSTCVVESFCGALSTYSTFLHVGMNF